MNLKELANLAFQNLNGRESDEEIFNAGIDAGFEELLNELEKRKSKEMNSFFREFYTSTIKLIKEDAKKS
jgi:hypothetical protein